MKKFILSTCLYTHLAALSPDIYIYTDFGGGKNQEALVSDLQTSGEIASAAWRATQHTSLYINDSAAPLDPTQAALRLAATFPCEPGTAERIERIVVHVIDPGVGNDQSEHPRSLILRKDGTLFIGPDNGTLSFACPVGSIVRAIAIDPNKLFALSGIDTKSGGTFHGRDLFSEAAFRIGAGTVSLDDLGSSYPEPELKNRFPEARPLRFARIDTQIARLSAEGDLFDTAFLLGVIQSPVPAEGSCKLFVIDSDEEPIAVINRQTKNIYIGPNNGLAVSFFKHYPLSAISAHSLSSDCLAEILKNPERADQLLLAQPLLSSVLKEVPFLGEAPSDHPSKVLARIWVDAYGNLKTTLQSSLLKEAREAGASIRVEINGIERPVIFADTFSEVPADQLFVYAGSSGVIGLNPHRSERYVELTANGVYGKFGVDFFIRDGVLPKSGDVATFYFDY